MGMVLRSRPAISRLLLLLACALLATIVPSAAQAAARPSMPYAWLDVASDTAATVRWLPVTGASAYVVLLDGAQATEVTETGVVISDLDPATMHTVQVLARGAGGESPKSDPVVVITRASAACTHYVSTSGSDAGTGSATSPWRTITRLVQSWEPGAVGCLDGAFVEDVSILRGGTSAAKVVLRARPGSVASIRGRLWIARGADNVVVAHLGLDGRAIKDTARNSLPSPTVNGANAMLLDNDITNVRTRVCVVLGSIRGYGAAVAPVLAYNRIHDCGRRGQNTHHGIYMESTRRAKIVNNVIFDNADRGIQLYPDAQGSLIAGNLIDGNGEGIIFSGAEGFASSRNVVIRNVISGSQLRSNVEHYWEQGPRRVGVGNVVARNCLGGARQGNFATPLVGYRAAGNATGVLRFVGRAVDDLRPTAESGCRNLLLSKMLPLARVA
ncbi:MAG: hypothetical protein JWL76_528 [Thermoleophilia bacterium]|nr:hypothetical protein [Thermoleophilia bacterium]